VEETLESVNTTASSESQLLVRIVFVVISKPAHELFGYDNFLWHCTSPKNNLLRD